MVSLELQAAFYQRLSDSPLLPLISELRSASFGEYIDVSNNASDLAINLIIAVKSNDKVNAEKYYAVFRKRQPSKDSHWIYDNYVLFSIVSAVVKFSLDTAWIANVINMSLSAANPTDRDIRETFKNLLSGNYNAKSDLHQISLVYQFLSKDEHFQDEHLNRTFNTLWNKPFPYYEDDFLNLLSLKAIEVIVVKKSLLSAREQYLLKEFAPLFERRVGKLSKVLATSFVLIVIIASFAGLWKLNAMGDKVPVFVKSLLALFGLSGVGVLGVLSWRKAVSKIFSKLINLLFGFKEVEP